MRIMNKYKLILYRFLFYMQNKYYKYIYILDKKSPKKIYNLKKNNNI